MSQGWSVSFGCRGKKNNSNQRGFWLSFFMVEEALPGKCSIRLLLLHNIVLRIHTWIKMSRLHRSCRLEGYPNLQLIQSTRGLFADLRPDLPDLITLNSLQYRHVVFFWLLTNKIKVSMCKTIRVLESCTGRSEMIPNRVIKKIKKYSIQAMKMHFIFAVFWPVC